MEVLLLALAGLGAGAANMVAGGGTFVSYPTLLALGYPPITANVTSAVGLLAGYLGGSVSYRRELAGQGTRLRQLIPAIVVGAVTGATLLLLTPGETFSTIVPYLVLSACFLLIVQPWMKGYVQRHRERNGRPESDRLSPAVHIGVAAAAVYGTYFGAGLGVLLLAVFGVLVADHLQRLNGLRSLISLLIKVIGVAVFAFSSQVAWLPVLVLAPTAYLGGALGAVVSRRLSEKVLRYTVIACGLVVAALLFMQ
ncbi:sulfite exporter TauE/SafE family protein [Mycolicibacterium chitae]|nr:sulfite exporter TauE/SafE family protein [Mycolicibacterium chitae]MCV7107112.1 sulfite exporter TauE/SafE family protein [Mycolicibacterium chitae]